MNKRIAKCLSALLLAAAVAVTQVPVSDVEAVSATSDFQMDGTKLLKYAGTAEVVSIPDGIKEIGEDAFSGNDNLIKVTVGGDVEKIGYRAFAECDNLRTIEVGDTVTDIETAAFSNNPALHNVSLGAKVKNIGSGVFAGDSNLSQLTVSKDNTYLMYSDGVLYDDEQTVIYALLPNYEKPVFNLPATVEEITAYAFWGNPYLEHVKIDSALKNISAYAFSNCMKLKEVTIPLAVHTIEVKAFEDCVNLQKVNLPDSITMIHDTAFDGCSQVEFEATPGTYAAEFAASRRASEVEDVEYQDVLASEVISTDNADAAEDSKEDNDEKEDNPEPTQMPISPNTVTGSYSSERLLGQSSIVAGRAVVFIDNGSVSVANGANTIQTGDAIENVSTENSPINNILSESAEKGKDFPKYTIINNKIATQAYYQDEELSEYEIEEGIKEIGDFAFARTGLHTVAIPENVETIGYAAFYHCDSLSDVQIPDGVKKIEANAFNNTPWLTRQLQSNTFVIVGDGILLAYSGSDSVVTIPEGVKQIGAEVFKDHMGITAVNIPDSVTVIGEAAFCGCKNLKTINGGNYLARVEDRAFQGCPLSQVVIPASMQEIGLAAYDVEGGTDTVVFMGSVIPKLVMGDESGRLSNAEGRTYAFGECKRAIVPTSASFSEGCVLDKDTYGFKGLVCDGFGITLMDLTQGVQTKSQSGVTVVIDSEVISSDKENIMATLPGNSGAYVLKIKDSVEAADRIAQSYGELYGGGRPDALYGFDIALYESGGEIPITKLGKQYITVLMPKPAGSSDGLHMVTLDADGQLESVEFQIVNLEDGDYIQFTTSHFSPYGIYKNVGTNRQTVLSDGSVYISTAGNKDITPDTGDFVHPKWILAIGLFAAAIAMFFYGLGKNNRKIK